MRHGIVVFAFVLAAGLLLSGDLDAGSLEPPGPPAPTMKSLAEVEARTPISSLPFTISQPGSYYLTGNLTGVAGQVGINITTSWVTVDLNGFSLIGVPSSLDGIRGSIAGTRHLVIKNGTIRSWGGSGIAASSASEVHVEDMQVDSNGNVGVFVGPNSIVRDTTVALNANTGIFADLSSTVIGSTARSNGGAGINVGGSSVVTDCTTQQNTTGISVGLAGRVSRSTARANLVGIIGSDAVSIEGCTVDVNTADGIRISNRGIVRGNIARGNTTNGIWAVGTENRVEDNEATANAAGIRVDGANNVIVKNSVGSNTTEYLIAAGNQVGTISTNPATAGPWANFDQ